MNSNKLKILRKLIENVVRRELNEAEKVDVERFFDALEKSPVSKKLKNLQNDIEKVQAVVRFANMIDLPLNRLSKVTQDIKASGSKVTQDINASGKK